MKKVLKILCMSTLLLTTSMMANEIDSASPKVEGVYLGLGGGVSFNLALLSAGNYQDDTSVYTSDSLGDSSGGYLVYGGYQFNKIIAVEAAYTDYGSFSDTLTDKSGRVSTFTSDPTSFTVYANAGYTFENGLRPFGQLGLGYLMVNGSNTTDRINIDDGVSMRLGLGVEYAPKTLSGFGFRVAYIDEMTMDSSYVSNDNGSTTTTLLMNINGMLYIGGQYKF